MANSFSSADAPTATTSLPASPVPTEQPCVALPEDSTSYPVPLPYSPNSGFSLDVKVALLSPLPQTASVDKLLLLLLIFFHDRPNSSFRAATKQLNYDTQFIQQYIPQRQWYPFLVLDLHVLTQVLVCRLGSFNGAVF